MMGQGPWVDCSSRMSSGCPSLYSIRSRESVWLATPSQHQVATLQSYVSSRSGHTLVTPEHRGQLGAGQVTVTTGGPAPGISYRQGQVPRALWGCGETPTRHGSDLRDSKLYWHSFITHCLAWHWLCWLSLKWSERKCLQFANKSYQTLTSDSRLQVANCPGVIM